MSEAPSQESRGPLRWLFWIPLASLLALEWYVRGYDGWGAWAAAPILFIPGFISFAIVVPGLFDCAAELRAGALKTSTLLFTLVAGLPILWLGVRRFFV